MLFTYRHVILIFFMFLFMLKTNVLMVASEKGLRSDFLKAVLWCV